MHRVIRTSRVVIAFILTLESISAVFAGETIARPVAPAKAGPPAVHWSVCTGGINVGGRPGQTVAETYLSAPFDAGDTPIPGQSAAFEKFLRSQYGITTESLSLYCQGMVDETQALESIKTWTTRANATGKAIDTGWMLGK